MTTINENSSIVSELKSIKEELSALRRDMNQKNYISEEEFIYTQSEQFKKDKLKVCETIEKLEKGELKTYSSKEFWEKIDNN